MGKSANQLGPTVLILHGIRASSHGHLLRSRCFSLFAAPAYSRSAWPGIHGTEHQAQAVARPAMRRTARARAASPKAVYSAPDSVCSSGCHSACHCTPTINCVSSL